MNVNEPASQDRSVGERTARRRDQKSSRGSKLLVVLMTVLAVAVLGVGGWAVWPRGGDASAATSAVSSSGVSSTSGATSTAGVSTPADPGKSATTSVSPAPVTQVARVQLTACRAEVARGDALAAASSSVADHWEGHTSALTRLKAGEITQAEAEVIWKRTKLAGPSDVKRYEAASVSYEQKQGACTRMSALPSTLISTGTQCTKRADANSAIAVKSMPVAAAWAGHVSAMKVKSETPVGPYMATWTRQVADAPTILSAYRTAASTQRETPRCPGA